MKRALTIILGLAFSPFASAQDIAATGGYLGFSLGSLDYEENVQDLGLNFSDSTTAYRLFGGYRLDENFAFEAGWGATGDLKQSYTDGVDTATIKADYEILTLRALGIAPLSSVSLYGGVGYYDSSGDASLSVSGFGEIVSVESDDSGATLVGGLQFDLEKISIRGEYEWFDTDSSVDAWDISIGFLVRL